MNNQERYWAREKELQAYDLGMEEAQKRLDKRLEKLLGILFERGRADEIPLVLEHAVLRQHLYKHYHID